MYVLASPIPINTHIQRQIHTVGVIKTVTLPFHSVPFRRRCTRSCQPFHFRSVCMRAYLVIGRGLSTCKKRKANTLTRRLESIVSYCYGLLNCFGAVNYCRSSILSEFCDRGPTGFEVCYRQTIDLALPIDSDRLQMRSLG